MNHLVSGVGHESKKHTITKHAIEEFSHYTYEESSLNQILLRANVSKGSFYYYFKNKQELYETCQDYALKVFNNYVGTYTQEFEGFIERLLRVNKFKKGFKDQYPDILKFFMQQYYKRLFPQDVLEELDQLDASFKKNLTEDINYKLFRDDLNIEHALQLLKWTIIGFEKNVEEQTIKNLYDFNNMDNCFKESEAYFKTLKSAYYKKTL